MQNYLTEAAPTIREEDTLYYPLSDGLISYIDVRDVAAFAARMLTEKGHEGKTYSITGARVLSNYAISDIFSHVLQRPIYYEDISDDEARRRMLEIGYPHWLQDALIELYSAQRNNHSAIVTDTFEKIMGREPIDFEEFVADHKTAFQKERVIAYR
jgi:uncharacterized protein YbjT (DUF2867 family)